MAKFSKTGHAPDYFFLTAILMITLFGLLMLASASTHMGITNYGDPYYYLKRQLTHGLLVGVCGFLLAYFVYYRNYQKMALPFLLISIAALVLVFTKLGVSAGGADRWVRLGPITFQPAEIMKLTYTIYLAAWISNAKINRRNSLYEGFIPFLMISGLVGGLLFLQPATSTVVILIGSGMVMYFINGAPWKYLGMAILLGVIALGVLILVTPYRFNRVMGFLNQQSDTEGSGYHLNQSRIAIGSGKIWGVGYGNSTSKISFLPDPIADSIFAVIGEEFGFVGAASLAVLFLIIIMRIFWIAKRSRDKFARAMLVGFGTIIAAQALLHMGAISGIFPLTGVPLPFISYGGTALAIFLTMSGIVANVSKYI